MRIQNKGEDPIEDYKILLNFDGDFQDLSETNETEVMFPMVTRYVPNTELFNDSKSGIISPVKNILVGGDSLLSEEIFIKPLPQKTRIRVLWKLISKDFKDKGELVINFEPIIERESVVRLIADPIELRRLENDNKANLIEDFLISNEKE